MFRRFLNPYYPGNKRMWSYDRKRMAVTMLFWVIGGVVVVVLFTAVIVSNYNQEQSYRTTYNERMERIPQTEQQKHAKWLLAMSDANALELNSWIIDSLRQTAETGTFAPVRHASVSVGKVTKMLTAGFLCGLLLISATLLLNYARDSYALRRHLMNQPRDWSTVSFVLVTLLPFGWICYSISAVRLWQTRHDGKVVAQTTST